MLFCQIFLAITEVSLPTAMADLLYLNILKATCRSRGTVQPYLVIEIVTTLGRFLNQFLSIRSILILTNHVVVSILLGILVYFPYTRQTIFFHLLILLINQDSDSKIIVYFLNLGN